MDVERARAYLLALPHVVETVQWGNNLVFWVGDKAVGGKMFCLIDLDGGEHVVSFAAGAERFHELVEQDGLVPAPYFARIFWVAAERWSVLRNGEWEELLSAAREMTYEKLSKRMKETLALPKRELEKVVVARRKVLAAKAGKSKR